MGAGLRAARRPDPRPDPRLRPCQSGHRRQGHEGGAECGAGPSQVHRGKKFVEEVAERSKPCAIATVPASTSPSTSTAQSAPTASLLIKALEPYQPMFYEEPVQPQNVDVMAEIARKTTSRSPPASASLPSGASARSWRKRAAMILQPDLCHAGGITEVRLIAGMAEAYYAPIAPHNPQGPFRWPPASRSPRRSRTSSARSVAMPSTPTSWRSPCRR